MWICFSTILTSNSYFSFCFVNSFFSIKLWFSFDSINIWWSLNCFSNSEMRVCLLSIKSLWSFSSFDLSSRLCFSVDWSSNASAIYWKTPLLSTSLHTCNFKLKRRQTNSLSNYQPLNTWCLFNKIIRQNEVNHVNYNTRSMTFLTTNWLIRTQIKAKIVEIVKSRTVLRIFGKIMISSFYWTECKVERKKLSLWYMYMN